MSRHHRFDITTRWTGNRGSGTLDYRAYTRDHLILAKDKASEISGSSDPAFRGDPSRYSPEELFISSLSACHMLWYLHLASVSGIVVLEYEDRAEGTMEEDVDGAGRFTSITLRPIILIAGTSRQGSGLTDASQVQKAMELHNEVGQKCFIANSIKAAITYAGQVSSVSGSVALV